MTTWQSNDDVRRDAGAEIAEFDDAPPDVKARREPDDADEDEEPEDPDDPQDRRLLQQYPDAANLPEPDAPSRRMEGERDDSPRER
jgi:hypothetical protein